MFELQSHTFACLSFSISLYLHLFLIYSTHGKMPPAAKKNNEKYNDNEVKQYRDKHVCVVHVFCMIHTESNTMLFTTHFLVCEYDEPAANEYIRKSNWLLLIVYDEGGTDVMYRYFY